MALVKVPWATGNMAENTQGLARQAFYDSTGGAEGISSVGALKVQAQATPNGTVRVAPGGAILNNRYDLSLGQSYAARNASQTSVTVTATGSSGGRTDAVLLRVLDPEFEGQPPADPNDFQYTRLVTVTAPAGITDIAQLGLAYPAILLARITIPANTGTITNAMVTDLRKVAQPRRKTELRTVALTSGDGVATLGSTTAYPGGMTWPAKAEISYGAFDIPEWATRCKIVLTWAGIRVPAGDAHGLLWVQVGMNTDSDKFQTQAVNYDGSGTTSVSRMMHIVADERPIPVSMRGTSRQIYPRGQVASSVPAAQRWQMDAGSAVVLQVEFMEQAD